MTTAAEVPPTEPPEAPEVPGRTPEEMAEVKRQRQDKLKERRAKLIRMREKRKQVLLQQAARREAEAAQAAKDQGEVTAEKVEASKQKVLPDQHLGRAAMRHVDVIPVSAESYNKTTQTLAVEGDERQTFEFEDQDEGENATLPAVPPPVPRPEPPPLTDDERTNVMASRSFATFFSKASKVVQMLLEEDTGSLATEERRGTPVPHNEDKRIVLTPKNVFTHDSLSGRSVTSIAWSPKHPELFLASYDGLSSRGELAMAGSVVVWSLHMKERAECHYVCRSPVTVATFVPYRPFLVAAGTACGQIVIWDTRLAKRTPWLRSPLSPEGHTHPVYCAQAVGTNNNINLITVSTDGRLCAWPLDNLDGPLERFELRYPRDSSVPLHVTALCFPAKSTNKFFVGTEGGVLYSGSIHGSDQGLDQEFRDHQGCVTAVDVHPQRSSGPVDTAGRLVLTSCTDWTARLWNTNAPGPAASSFEESGDYVYDVKWSPTHPGVFATADGAGRLLVWDITRDLEGPVAEAAPFPASLHKLCFSPDGTKIVAGDSRGSVYFFSLPAELYEAGPSDWEKLEEVMTDLKPDV